MDNKLSELSKPVGFVSKQAQAILNSGDTASIRPFFDVQGSSPLYSQEYVSALLAELEAKDKRIAELEAKTAMTMSVGSGNGNLFVHGDYDSIKAAQAIVLENESLRAKLVTPVRLPRPGFVTCSGERHYTYGADEVKGAIHAAGFTVDGDE